MEHSYKIICLEKQMAVLSDSLGFAEELLNLFEVMEENLHAFEG